MKRLWNKLKDKWKEFQESIEEILVEIAGEVD
jgi:hypothetical protein